MAGGRPVRPMGIRALFSYPLFVSALFSLLFLASISAILFRSGSGGGGGGGPDGPSSSARRSFLALKSADPLRSRLDLLRRQAADHSALASAYAAYARRLKLDQHRQLRTFSSLAASLSALSSRAASLSSPLDDDSLRPLEKESKDRVKLTRQLVAEAKESFDTQLKIQKLRDTVFAVREQLARARRLRSLSSTIAAGSTPKSLHCLAMRLLEDLISHPESYPSPPSSPHLHDPNRYHYAIFSDNIIAVSVVVGSAVRNAADPRRHIFHVVTDPMYLNAMRAWFARRPLPGGATIDIRSASDFAFLNSSYSPVFQAVDGGRNDAATLDHLRFYLPELYPKLRKIVLLEDDVVVQKDLAGLWRVDMDGKVNAAVETCFGGFRRYARYLNFSHPMVRERFSPRACAWAFGVNVFDLDAWRGERCTEQFHYYQNLNENGTLWNSGIVLPAGLMTFYTATKPLDKSWHVMGLGYNPSVSQDEIRNAAVIHFNGNMKPWLDVAMNQYKHLWTKYVDTDMEFLQLCNFGV